MKKRFNFPRTAINKAWEKAKKKMMLDPFTSKQRGQMAWRIRIHSVLKIEPTWWEKIFIPEYPYVLKIRYWDDDPYFSNNIPERRNFYIVNNDFQEIIDWVVSHSPAADISKLTFLSVDEFEYIKLKIA